MKKGLIPDKADIHTNTGSLLFNKFGFAQKNHCNGRNQKCDRPRCLTCNILFNNLEPFETENLKIKFCDRSTCKTENIIYYCECIHCADYYFGKSSNPLHIRMNGHRSCFKFENNNYEDSALSQHIYDKHVENFDDKLDNFKVGIVKQTSTSNLNRAEDFYIWSTQANVFHLNRYK